MSDPAQQECLTPKPKRKRINYALAATLLAQHVTLDEAAKQVGAKDGNTLRVGLARHGVTATLARRSDDQTARAITVANKAVAEASEALRSDFSALLAKHVGQLGAVPAKANLKHLRQVANVAEPLARTAKIVCGWGDEGAAKAVDLSVMVAVRVDGQTPQEPTETAIDTPSVVVLTNDPEPASDTPTKPA